MSSQDPQQGGPLIPGAYPNPPYMIIQPNTSAGGQYSSTVQYITAPMPYSQFQAAHFPQERQFQPQQQVLHIPVSDSNGRLSALSMSGYNLPVKNRFQVLDNNNEFPPLSEDSDEDMSSVNPRLAEGLIDGSVNEKIRFPSLGLNPSLGRKRVRSPVENLQSIVKRQELEAEVSGQSEIPLNELLQVRVEFEVTDKNEKLADDFSISKCLKENVFPIKFDFESNRERNVLIVHVNDNEEAEKVMKIQSIGGVSVRGKKKECIKRGIIKGVPLYLSNEQLKECIESSVEITEVIRQKRYNRDLKKLEDSYAVMVVFTGNFLPPSVWCCGRKKEVFVYNRRILQCFKCQRYGHVQKNCRANEPVCLRCCGKHESVSCPLKNSDPAEKVKFYKCANCKGCHSSTSRECPIRQQNRNILEMAEKYNMGYRRAQVMYRTYAQAIHSNQIHSAKSTQRSGLPNQGTEQDIYRRVSDTVTKILVGLLLSPDLLDMASLPLLEKVEKLCSFINELNMGPIDCEAIRSKCIDK